VPGARRVVLGATGEHDRGKGWQKMTVDERLDRIEHEWLPKIEGLLDILVERQQVREYYTVEEFARIVGRSEFTCREYFRLGRLRASKRGHGAGQYKTWAISHDELLRFQREGLLPIQRPV
jgi:hypothetical protein